MDTKSENDEVKENIFCSQYEEDLPENEDNHMRDLEYQGTLISHNEMHRDSELQDEPGRAYLHQDYQEPFIGMEFDSPAEVYEFYNTYAKRVGFSTRKGGHYKSKLDHSVISRQYFCSRVNSKKKQSSVQSSHDSSVVDGCKAKITVKKRNNKWRVTKFEKEHNHELASPSTVHLLRSHRETSRAQRRLITKILKSGINPINIVSAIAQSSLKIRNIKFRERDCRPYVGQNKLGSLGIDAHSLLDYFKSIQAKNPTFFYAIQVDEGYAVKNIFWVDARCRSVYTHFSDVICLDITYKRSRSSLPFVSIIGVNHHRQSVLFGCSFLSDETESTFIWLFETWLEAMNNQHPNFIIIDQDKAAIRAAVGKIFPRTRHRFCKWHILRKVAEKLSPVVHLYDSFIQEIENVVNCSDATEEFEEAWRSLIQKYNLQENEWLKSLFNDRYYWVPSYLRDTFFAGLSAVVLSDTVTPIFDGYINENSPLHEFIKQYEKALEKQYEEEVFSDFNTLTTRPILKTPVPMEEQASKVYTHNVFALFQEEIIQSLALSIKNVPEEGPVSIFTVKKYGTHQREYIVSFNLDTKNGDCSCRKFDFEGIICRHLLAVFKRLEVFELPSHFILKRWTRDAKKGKARDKFRIEDLSKGLDTMSLRYYSLCKEALKCAEEGACSTELFRVTLRGFRETKEKLLVAKQNMSMLLTPSNHPSQGLISEGDMLI